jgi:ElaB/YqjD/DUF883 family membrane-anchored ribosome-binding protein
METMKAEDGHNINLDRLLEDLKAVLRDGEELLKSGVSTVKERASAGARTTDQAVREHPYRTMGIVFGVGLVIGILASGSLRRRAEAEE